MMKLDKRFTQLLYDLKNETAREVMALSNTNVFPDDGYSDKVHSTRLKLTGDALDRINYIIDEYFHTQDD